MITNDMVFIILREVNGGSAAICHKIHLQRLKSCIMNIWISKLKFNFISISVHPTNMPKEKNYDILQRDWCKNN